MYTAYMFKHDYRPLLQDVGKAVYPIYINLRNERLLERRVSGYTQNNESYNHLI